MKKKLDKIIVSYKNFFDKKIENSTIIVALMCFIIFLVGFFVNINGNIELGNSLKANILEVKKKNNNINIITIDGKKYKLILIK